MFASAYSFREASYAKRRMRDEGGEKKRNAGISIFLFGELAVAGVSERRKQL
jgi:hypothetical protein